LRRGKTRGKVALGETEAPSAVAQHRAEML
jgi:hypothetical protein